MNGRPETLTEQDTPRTPAPGVGWEEFSRELVEFFASIKLAMFLFLFIAIIPIAWRIAVRVTAPKASAAPQSR